MLQNNKSKRYVKILTEIAANDGDSSKEQEDVQERGKGGYEKEMEGGERKKGEEGLDGGTQIKGR